jgi:hypothetical protein
MREIADFGVGVVTEQKLYFVIDSLTITIVLRRVVPILQTLDHDYLLLPLGGTTCAACLIAQAASLL